MKINNKIMMTIHQTDLAIAERLAIAKVNFRPSKRVLLVNKPVKPQYPIRDLSRWFAYISAELKKLNP